MVLSFALAFALAAPPVPVLNSPIDGGWAARRPAIDYSLPFNTTPETTGAEFQFLDGLGNDAGFLFSARSGIGSQTFTGPSLPDASFYTWRGRGVDDAGLASAWSAPGTFLVDDLAPAIPSSFSVYLDAGVLMMFSAPTTDTQSGLGYYHFGLSRLDQLDGSINYGGTVNLNPIAPTISLLIGPGTYNAGLHVHDVVGNAFVAQSLSITNLVVTADLVLPRPQPPEIVRGDGGLWTTFPFLPVDFVRFRVDAGGLSPVVGFALSRRGRAETEWELCASGPGPLIVQTLPSGDQDVRVAVLTLDRVSDWSNPLRVFVDEGDPNTPNLTASVDAGEVLLRWPATRDPGGSGVLDYRVSRCCVADASVSFPNVLNVPDASITFLDTPGFGVWVYSVTAVDRAGNQGAPGTAAVTVSPNAPSGLRATPAVTSLPIALAWDEDRDGGFSQVWSLRRVDANDAGTLLSPDIGVPSFTDDAPEGRWSYEVVAVVGPARSVPSRLDGVVRDQTPPVVSTPTLTRVGARIVEVQFTAIDALSGLANAHVERETNGGASVDLGATFSPFTDTPGVDGTHHYRIVGTDKAGNVATSAWSADFVTPGAGLIISAVEPQSLTCGRTLELQLSASESATWSLVSAPDGVSLEATSGLLTWTPAASDVGEVTVRVKAQGASSLDERDVTLDVNCTVTRLGVGCGCSSVEILALAAVTLLLRRRRH